LQRLVAEPGRSINDHLVQSLVARAGFEGVGDPRARPVVMSRMKDALRIGLLKPWRRIELKSQGIIGGVACSANHYFPPAFAVSKAILPYHAMAAGQHCQEPYPLTIY